MKQNKDKIIECIAKENYDHFGTALKETQMCRQGKQLVIFGAGILGLQFYDVLEQAGISNIVFCDNDRTKWGKQIERAKILAPKEIIQVQDFFVFIAVENYENIVAQIEGMGYRQNENYYNLTNCSEEKLIKDFTEDMQAEVLVLGDCMLSMISVNDEKKQSIAEMLYQKNHVKVLGLNGIYMRTYYHLIQMSLKKMHNLKKTVVLLGIDIFGEMYHLFPKNQHEHVLKQLTAMFGDDEELKEFVQEAKKRANETNLLGQLSPNREAGISEEQIEQQRRIHMRLNYLYKLKPETESMRYLKKTANLCSSKGIESIFVIMPINYEMGERYFSTEFYKRYEATCESLHHCITENGGIVLDLSYLLKMEEFIALRSTNEGIRAKGREKIAEEIKK